MCVQTRRWLIAIRIFGLALQIRRNRAVMGRLIRRGGPYTSPKLVKLSGATVQLGYQTHRLLCKWEKAAPQAQVSNFPDLCVEREERSA